MEEKHVCWVRTPTNITLSWLCFQWKWKLQKWSFPLITTYIAMGWQKKQYLINAKPRDFSLKRGKWFTEQMRAVWKKKKKNCLISVGLNINQLLLKTFFFFILFVKLLLFSLIPLFLLWVDLKPLIVIFCSCINHPLCSESLISKNDHFPYKKDHPYHDTSLTSLEQLLLTCACVLIFILQV